MLIDRENLHHHRLAIAFVLTIGIASVAWYVFAATATGSLPGGSSLPGFTFGVAGALIIIFELLLWPRQRVRSWRIGRAFLWLRWHVWLGLLSVPLVVLHTGFHLGGQLSTLLSISFGVVIASGVFGLALQQVLPKAMLELVPAETIYSQISHVAGQWRREADALVRAVCGAPDLAADGDDNDPEVTEQAFLTVGALRAVGRVQGKLRQSEVPLRALPETAALELHFDQSIGPFIANGGRSVPRLATRSSSQDFFDRLRTEVHPQAGTVIAQLESLCEQRRQLDRQARIHTWLHVWRAVHLAGSCILMVLLGMHIVFALRYW